MTQLYLYGMTRAGPLPAGLAERGIELVAADGRAAIVSSIESSPVTATRRNLLAHAEVVERLHERAIVLPARFGTVVADRDAALELLALPGVAALLDEHADRSELTLRGTYDESVLRAIAPAVAGLREGYRAAPTLEGGLALGEAVVEALAARRIRDTEEVLSALDPHVVGVRSGEPRGEYGAFNLSLLVTRDAVATIEDELELLARRLSPPLRFELVGPLPPYSFVELELGVPA